MTKTIEELEREMRVLDQMDAFSDDDKRTVALQWNLLSSSLISQNEEKEEPDYERFRQFAKKHAQQKAVDLLAAIVRPTNVDRANHCVQSRWLIDCHLENKALPDAIQVSERSLSFQERFPHTMKELAQSYFDTGYLYLMEVNQTLIQQEVKAVTEPKAEEKEAVITIAVTPVADPAFLRKAFAYLEFAADNEDAFARDILTQYYCLYKKTTHTYLFKVHEKISKTLIYAAYNQVYPMKAEKILSYFKPNDFIHDLELRGMISEQYIKVINDIAASEDKSLEAFYRLIDDEGYPFNIPLPKIYLYAYICSIADAKLGVAKEQMTSALISRGYTSSQITYFHAAKLKENSESHVIDAALSATSGNFPRDILRIITGYMGIDDRKGTNLQFWKSAETHAKKKRKTTDNDFGKALQDIKKWREQIAEGGSQALEAEKKLEEMCDINQDLKRVDSNAATQVIENDVDDTIMIKPGM